MRLEREGQYPGVYFKKMSGLVTIWDMNIASYRDESPLSNEVLYTVAITLEEYLSNRLGTYLLVGVYPKENDTGFYIITRFVNRVKIHELVKDYTLFIQKRLSFRGAYKGDLKSTKSIMLNYYDKYLRFTHRATNY